MHFEATFRIKFRPRCILDKCEHVQLHPSIVVTSSTNKNDCYMYVHVEVIPLYSGYYNIHIHVHVTTF